jgi:hypothetical protein
MKSVGALSQVRKTIQASIFRTLGFDIGFTASAMATDAVFRELAKFEVDLPRHQRLTELDPIEELSAEPLLPWDDEEGSASN